jgi:adenosylcobinamide-GDP ribazoletransferase
VIHRQLAAVATSIQFLTRVPLPGGMNRPDPDLTLLRAAVVYFPLVGGLVGLCTGTVIWSALHVWPPLVAVVSGLIVEALLTGGFHEDAVADCCDAFGGGWSKDDVLRILKDSRIGSYGALGLGLALLLRGSCLLALPEHLVLPAVVASAAVGRWAVLILMLSFAPVPNREGLSKDVGQQIGWREFLVGCGFLLLAVLGMACYLPIAVLVGVLATAMLTFLWGRYVHRRIGGITGDVLGTACYLGQCALLLAILAVPG